MIAIPYSVTHSPRWLSQHAGLSLVVFSYLVAAVSFAIVTPPFEAPDETGHLFYINHVATTGRLPVQTDPTRAVVGEGHQFPLYYVIAAIPVRAFLADNSVDLLPIKNRRYEAPDAAGRHFPKFLHRDVEMFASGSDQVMFYLLRGYSIVLGALTVLLTYAIAGMILSEPRFQLLAAGFVATLPQFLFISASINNDNLVTLASTATIYAALRFSRLPSVRVAIALGLLLGMALLAKKSALFLIPAVVVIVAVPWVRREPDRPTVARSSLIAIGVAALLGAPVFIRNQIVYGDPLGTAMERETLPELVDEKSLWNPYWVETFLPRLLESFVGVFGWMNVWLPPAVYLVYLALGLFALLGLLRWASASSSNDRRVVGFLFMSAVLCLAGVVYYNLTYTQYQGRFLFPAIAPIAALSALGLWQWRVAAGERIHKLVGPGLAILLVAIDIVSLVIQWQFHYRAGQYLA